MRFADNPIIPKQQFLTAGATAELITRTHVAGWENLLVWCLPGLSASNRVTVSLLWFNDRVDTNNLFAVPVPVATQVLTFASGGVTLDAMGPVRVPIVAPYVTIQIAQAGVANVVTVEVVATNNRVGYMPPSQEPVLRASNAAVAFGAPVTVTGNQTVLGRVHLWCFMLSASAAPQGELNIWCMDSNGARQAPQVERFDLRAVTNGISQHVDFFLPGLAVEATMVNNDAVNVMQCYFTLQADPTPT